MQQRNHTIQSTSVIDSIQNFMLFPTSKSFTQLITTWVRKKKKFFQLKDTIKQWILENTGEENQNKLVVMSLLQMASEDKQGYQQAASMLAFEISKGIRTNAYVWSNLAYAFFKGVRLADLPEDLQKNLGEGKSSWQLAAECWTLALSIEPKNIIFWNNLILFFDAGATLDDFPAAVIDAGLLPKEINSSQLKTYCYLKTMFLENLRQPDIWFVLGVALMKKVPLPVEAKALFNDDNNFKQSIPYCWSKTLAHYPNHKKAWIHLGRSFRHGAKLSDVDDKMNNTLAQSSLKPAIYCHTKAISLDKNYWLLWYSLARLFQKEYKATDFPQQVQYLFPKNKSSKQLVIYCYTKSLSFREDKAMIWKNLCELFLAGATHADVPREVSSKWGICTDKSVPSNLDLADFCLEQAKKYHLDSSKLVKYKDKLERVREKSRTTQIKAQKRVIEPTCMLSQGYLQQTSVLQSQSDSNRASKKRAYPGSAQPNFSNKKRRISIVNNVLVPTNHRTVNSLSTITLNYQPCFFIFPANQNIPPLPVKRSGRIFRAIDVTHSKQQPDACLKEDNSSNPESSLECLARAAMEHTR